MPKRNRVLETLTNIAEDLGIPVREFLNIAQIESSLNPKARTGSYKGLFQLSSSEFNRYGSGSIFNAEDNARAAGKKWLSDVRYFKKRVGRDPSSTEIYLMHQQGRAGYTAHAANPSGVAWKNILPYYSTKEAKRRGFSSREAYAKAAVWGNIPRSARKQFAGGVDDVTSEAFTDVWRRRVQRGLGNRDSATPPIPGQKPPAPQRRAEAFPFGGPTGTLPEDRGFVGTGEGRISDSISPKSSTVPVPASRRDIGAKFQSRLPEDTGDLAGGQTGGGILPPPFPEEGMRSPSRSPLTTGLSRRELNDVFGAPFGELFRAQPGPNEVSVNQPGTTGVPSPPPKPPLFRNFFASLFGR